MTAICKKARSAAILQRKGENAPRFSISRSASHFPRYPPDFSTRREKNLRNFFSPLFACKSILHFARCENNILPSILKRGFLPRSLIKISAFENSHPHPSSLSRPCRPPFAAPIPHATHRRTRAFSLDSEAQQHPRLPVFRAIYEKAILRTSTRADLSLFFARAVSGVQRMCRSGMCANGRRAAVHSVLPCDCRFCRETATRFCSVRTVLCGSVDNGRKSMYIIIVLSGVDIRARRAV